MEIEILDELKKQDWKDLRRKLIAYATFKSKFFKINCLKKEVSDYVDDAIAKTYTGKRKWNPVNVDLIRFLKLAIDSEFSNQINRKETKKTVCKDFTDDSINYLLKDDNLSPEEELIFSEEISRIKECLREDEDAEIVFELLQDGLSYDLMCEDLGINKNQLNNIIKRLKRKTKKLYEN